MSLLIAFLEGVAEGIRLYQYEQIIRSYPKRYG